MTEVSEVTEVFEVSEVFGVSEVLFLFMKALHMKNREFGYYMEARTKEFAIRVIRLSAVLPNTVELKVIKHQLVKSATSIGANYREANTSRSKADFNNRIKICRSEANETIYWLEILFDIQKTDISKLIDEARELLAIFMSIVKKLNT